MNNLLRLFSTVILWSCLIIGCGSMSAEKYNAIQENHAATKTYREGKWKVRYDSMPQQYSGKIESTTYILSVDVLGELTEEDMLDIMDYYEFTGNAQWDMNNRYLGEKETDYTCYAVFYKGDTDEEIRRIKYLNRKEVEIPEDEQGYFAPPYFYSDEEQIGEAGINGPLP